MASRKRGITPSARDPVRRKKSTEDTDNIEVVCRLCPYNGNSPSLICIDDNAIQTVLPPPQYRRDNAPNVEKIFSFGRVFNEDDGQATVFERTSIDLILNLLRGRNSLLFTYGVTGSGKTYTMTGRPTEEETGLLPRTLDVIFNSVHNRVEKCIFYPAGMNTFAVRGSLDAHLKRRQNENDFFSTSKEMADRYREEIRIGGFNEDYVCSIFVSYVEIYNNFCYDLLEDARNGNLTKRDLRHDRNQQIFVDGAKEIEVESSEEALEVFCLGEERRRVSSTLLNKDSSRSHSVFTIKLVMAPRAYDSQTVYPVQDNSKIVVSQLCMVDLAGSERAKRTQNVGDRLAEANSINQSLMVLRQCIEVLKRNQRSSAIEQVPYRQSKLTHLFKNYLEGNGKIRMVICVNPKPEDYDENLSALAFAEESQTVEVKKQVVRMQSDRIPHSFYTAWNAQMDALASEARVETPVLPNFRLKNADDESTVEEMMKYVQSLQNRSSDSEKLRTTMMGALRQYMMEADYLRSSQEQLKETLEEKEAEITKLKNMCSKYKREVRSLRERVISCEAEEEVQMMAIEKLRERGEVDRKAIEKKDRALKKVKGIISNPSPSVASLRSRFDKENEAPTQTPPPPYMTPGRSVYKKNVETVSSSGLANGRQGYVNPKYHRRSKSAPRVLDHQPLHRVPTGTILSTKTPSNAIRTTKPEIHQLNKSGEYRLTHQQVDDEGNISTSVVKGECLPTVGGGTSVLFNDIERLTHENPSTKS